MDEATSAVWARLVRERDAFLARADAAETTLEKIEDALNEGGATLYASGTLYEIRHILEESRDGGD